VTRLKLVVLLGCGACQAPSEWVAVALDGGRLVIPTEAEGTPLRCFVDTGSDGTYLASDLGIYGHPRLDIGGWKLKIDADHDEGIDAALASMTFDGESPNCWLGWDSLREVAFTVDYARSRVRIGPSGPDAAWIEDADLAEPIVTPLSNLAQVPVLSATVQDVEVSLIADLGADAGILHPDVIAEMADPPTLFPTQGNTAEGRVSFEIGIVDEVEIEGVAHQKVEFAVYDSPTIARLGEGLDGVLGGSTFPRYAVTFDGPAATLTLQAEAE
jgi:hypothetical protein